MKLRHLPFQALITVLGVLGTGAQAQTYPNKTISMVVPWPAGGATDAAGKCHTLGSASA
jgi:tripartite-type tricarboxylate transporter receptor subunit TctC